MSCIFSLSQKSFYLLKAVFVCLDVLRKKLRSLGLYGLPSMKIECGREDSLRSPRDREKLFGDLG